jgi:plasmid stabilization system protein ParE
MSSPNYPLILSDLAQADYEDILAYTLRTWDARQYAIYATC